MRILRFNFFICVLALLSLLHAGKDNRVVPVVHHDDSSVHPLRPSSAHGALHLQSRQHRNAPAKDSVAAIDSSTSFDDVVVNRHVPRSALPGARRASVLAQEEVLPGAVVSPRVLPDLDPSLGVAAHGSFIEEPSRPHRIPGAGVGFYESPSPRLVSPQRVFDAPPVVGEGLLVGKLPLRVVPSTSGIGLDNVTVSLRRISPDAIASGSGVRAVRGLRNQKEKASLSAAEQAGSERSRDAAWLAAHQRGAHEKLLAENPELVRKGFIEKRTRDTAEQVSMLKKEIKRLEQMKKDEALYLIKMRAQAEGEGINQRTTGVRGTLQKARAALRERGWGVDPASEIARFEPHQDVIQRKIHEHQKALDRLEARAASVAAKEKSFSGI